MKLAEKLIEISESMNYDDVLEILNINSEEELDERFEEVEEYFNSDIDEASIYVIRDGKKVKKKLVRAKRRKRMTPKQKAGVRKAVRKRKAKKGQINRKRKKSNKIRSRKNLKRNTNKRMKVAGTSTRKR